MLNKMLMLIALTLFIMLTWQCSGCKEDPCSDGFESINGICQCPKGKYEIAGLCRTLGPDEYYAFPEKCLCTDTSIFLVGPKIYDAERDRNTMKITRYIFTYGRSKEPDPVHYEYNFDYYKLSSGAEVLYGTNVYLGECEIYGGQQFNRGFILGDTIKLLKLKERDPFAINIIIDTLCTWNLHK